MHSKNPEVLFFMIQIIAGLSSPFLKTMQLSISKMTKFVGV